MKPEFTLLQDVSLQNLNSFGINAIAHQFLRIESLAQLEALQRQYQLDPELCSVPRLILGGGSNLILSDRLPHLVLQMAMMGRELVGETEDAYLVRAGAGENWHRFVLWTLDQGYPGLENLSLIPGTVGASPIQNIGAYGVEMQDYFHSLQAWDFVRGELITLFKNDCAFAYRDSIFKNGETDRYAIVSVCFALPKIWHPRLNYGDVAKYLSDRHIDQARPSDVSNAIISIRQSKLPDPAVLGNAGSFFKNPIVSAELCDQIVRHYPHCISYPQPNGTVKLAAGWLIEQAGWKGYRGATVGVYDKQALVLINLGGATGSAVRRLAEQIQVDVEAKFGVRLEVEPVFV